MRQDAGRAVLARILIHTGFLGTSWDADPRTHAMREGKRLEGLWLFQEMQEADSELAKLIITEYLRHADQ